MIKFVFGAVVGGLTSVFIKKYKEMVSEINRLKRDNDNLNERVQELENK